MGCWHICSFQAEHAYTIAASDTHAPGYCHKPASTCASNCPTTHWRSEGAAAVDDGGADGDCVVTRVAGHGPANSIGSLGQLIVVVGGK